MKIGNNKITYAVIVAIFFLLGITCGVLIRDFPYLSLKREVSLGELGNFFLALFVAIYVPFFLNKKINNKRVEKDILIEACSKLDKELYKLKQVVESAYVGRKTIKREVADTIILRTRSISNLLNVLKQNLDSYENVKEIKKTISELIKNQNTYWDDLTFNLRDKKPKITDEKYLKTEQNLNEYSSNLYKLKLLLNAA